MAPEAATYAQNDASSFPLKALDTLVLQVDSVQRERRVVELKLGVIRLSPCMSNGRDPRVSVIEPHLDCRVVSGRDGSTIGKVLQRPHSPRICNLVRLSI